MPVIIIPKPRNPPILYYIQVIKLYFNPANLDHLTTNFDNCYQEDSSSVASQLLSPTPQTYNFFDIVIAIKETADAYKASKQVVLIDTHSTYVIWNHNVFPPDVKHHYLTKQQLTTILTKASLYPFYYNIKVPIPPDPTTNAPLMIMRHVTSKVDQDCMICLTTNDVFLS